MKQPIAGNKLGRLIYLLKNNSNATALENILIGKNVTGATATNVKEVGGTHLEFRFKLPADTEAGWLKKRAIRITKKFVDDYNQQAQEDYEAAVANNENPPDLDLDSNATRIAIATKWIRDSLKGQTKEIDPDLDLVNIIALSGKIDAANFLIEVKPAGQISDEARTYQHRLKAIRQNISTVLPEDPIVITSLNHMEIRQQLIASLNLPVPDEGEEDAVANLFEEDVAIQMTHYKLGQRYTAVITNSALDYYGEIQFTIGEEEAATNNATYNKVSGDLTYSGEGVYYGWSDLIDPAVNEVKVTTPDFGLVADFHLGFKVKVYGANGNDYVEIVDNLQVGPTRTINTLSNIDQTTTDNTLTAFTKSEITTSVTNNVVTVTIKDLGETPAADEVREYTLAGFSPVAGEKLFVEVQVDVNPANKPVDLSTVTTNIKVVAKSAVLP